MTREPVFDMTNVKDVKLEDWLWLKSGRSISVIKSEDKSSLVVSDYMAVSLALYDEVDQEFYLLGTKFS